MSQKERDRLTIMAGVTEQELTLVQAGELMAVSYRQSKRIWRRCQAEGDVGLVHRLRGRPSARRKPPTLRAQVLARYQEERYADFGPTLMAEHLAQEGLAVEQLGVELAQLDVEQKQISATDPDTRRMPTAAGFIVGYNAQMAVDAKHKLIAAQDVTNDVTDLKQLASVALEAKANLELKQAEVMADAGYYNAAEVSRCTEQGITPFIPKSDTSANTARGLYGKSQFQYDAARMCMCARREES